MSLVCIPLYDFLLDFESVSSLLFQLQQITKRINCVGCIDDLNRPFTLGLGQNQNLGLIIDACSQRTYSPDLVLIGHLTRGIGLGLCLLVGDGVGSKVYGHVISIDWCFALRVYFLCKVLLSFLLQLKQILMTEEVPDQGSLQLARVAGNSELVLNPVLACFLLLLDEPSGLDVFATEVSHSLILLKVR